MKTLDAPEYFQVAEGYARYSPVGDVSLQRAVDLVTEAIVFAESQHIERLLLDIRRLVGFDRPKTLDLFYIAKRVVQAAQLRLKLAFLARHEMLDPERFGLTVARNRGAIANAFSSEPRALDWLLGTQVV